MEKKGPDVLLISYDDISNAQAGSYCWKKRKKRTGSYRQCISG